MECKLDTKSVMGVAGILKLPQHRARANICMYITARKGQSRSQTHHQPCTEGGLVLSGGIKCLHTEAAEQPRNHGNFFLAIVFTSVIGKSSHCKFKLCTVLALLSGSMDKTTVVDPCQDLQLPASLASQTVACETALHSLVP